MINYELYPDDPKDPDYAGPCRDCDGPIPDREHVGDYPGALSRLDNVTYICGECGIKEAVTAWDNHRYADLEDTALLLQAIHNADLEDASLVRVAFAYGALMPETLKASAKYAVIAPRVAQYSAEGSQYRAGQLLEAVEPAAAAGSHWGDSAARRVTS